MVTDDELNAAAEEPSPEAPPEPIVEETVEEPVQEPEVPEEPTDNRERSNLGRRVKAMEDGLKTIVDKIDSYFTKQNSEPEADEEEIVTRKDLEKYLQSYQAKQQESAKQYEREYLQHESTLGMDMTDAEYTEIITERYNNFNTRYSDNPKADAELNFMKAYNAVLKKKVQPQRQNPLKGNKPEAPLGGPTQSVNTNRDPNPIHLDDAAKEYVQRMGISEEKVKAALSGEIPIHLIGSKGKVSV